MLLWMGGGLEMQSSPVIYLFLQKQEVQMKY